jgi:hypothetical protein
MVRAVVVRVLREEEAAAREIDRSKGVVRRKEDMCLSQVEVFGNGSSQKLKNVKL